jgi:NADH-quinone oxidoreductase subunit G
MCVFEDEKGNIDAACSAQPWPGMVIKTNTHRLRQYRKMIMELLLTNHSRDCNFCENHGSCKLQAFATFFNIDVKFPNTNQEPDIDSSSPCIEKDQSKCILCGDCVRMCNEVQTVGAIDFAHRGARMTVSTAFNEPLAESNCVGCGQCVVACPTGAFVPTNDTAKVWKELDDPNNKVIMQIAPAVRVAIGEGLGIPEGKNSMGKIVNSLRRMGAAEVFDTSTGADLTVVEEAKELLDRIKSGTNLPLLTSCCPAWVRFCENNYPEFLPNISTCKSPMQMLASVLREHNKDSEKRVVQVAIMPCTAKKYEALREEFKTDGRPDVDYVITTDELVQMIRESGIVFPEIDADSIDASFGIRSGAGVIFGVTGGVTEAVLRHISEDKSDTQLKLIAIEGIRGMEGVKEATVMVGDREVKIAVVSGLGNARELLERVKRGEKYDFIEVMACPGGCINGAGQPYASADVKVSRGKGLYYSDGASSVRRSEESHLVAQLYDGILKGKEHELLHVHTGENHD